MRITYCVEQRLWRVLTIACCVLGTPGVAISVQPQSSRPLSPPLSDQHVVHHEQPEIKRPRVWTDDNGRPIRQLIDVELLNATAFEAYLDASSLGVPLIVISAPTGWTPQKTQVLAWDDDRVRAMLGSDFHAIQQHSNESRPSPRSSEMLGDLSSGFEIYAIRDGRLFDTETPFDNAEELIEWLTSVKRGAISLDFAQRRAGTRDGSLVIPRRLVYANRLKLAGRDKEALEELMWVVECMYGTSHGGQVHLPRLPGWADEDESPLGIVQKWGDGEATIHDRLEALRLKLQTAAFANPLDRNIFQSWTYLAVAVTNTDGLLEFWKRLQKENQLAAVREDFRMQIMGTFLEAHKPRLGAELIENAFDIVNGQFLPLEQYEMIFEASKPAPNGDPSMRDAQKYEICGQCAIAYACLLAAGRDADAQFLADEVIRRSKWDGCKAYLVELALQVGEPREVHRTWAKEVMQLREIRAETDLVNRVDEALAKQASKK
jgi:hypothetical protein